MYVVFNFFSFFFKIAQFVSVVFDSSGLHERTGAKSRTLDGRECETQETATGGKDDCIVTLNSFSSVLLFLFLL